MKRLRSWIERQWEVLTCKHIYRQGQYGCWVCEKCGHIEMD
jgi:hypothetical protein